MEENVLVLAGEKLKKYREDEVCVKCGSNEKKVYYGWGNPLHTTATLMVTCRCSNTYYRATLDNKNNIDQ